MKKKMIISKTSAMMMAVAMIMLSACKAAPGGEDATAGLKPVTESIKENAVTSGDMYVTTREPVAPEDWLVNLPAAKDSNTKQLFVVAGSGMDRTTATIYFLERDEAGSWKQILSTPGFVGKNGLCPDADHAEGCGQTPIGTYRFNKAFGIADDPGCAIPYVKATEDTYWSGDPRDGMHYNEMVDIKDYPDLIMDDSEHIVDYVYQYQYCLNISFNEDGTPGRGSAIFLHCFGPEKPYTGGCVAVPEYTMKTIMQRVDPDCVVVIDTMDALKNETADAAVGDIELPAYEYPGPELFYSVLYQYLIDELGTYYDHADVAIPCPIIIAEDESDKSDIKVWGDFWYYEYEQKGDTLETTAGGSYPGLIHVKYTDEGYEVTGMEVVGDGSDFDPSAKRIFGDHYNDFLMSCANTEGNEQTRAQIIANYVAANNLPITQYRDFGWDPVKLPEENIDSFYSDLN